MIRWNVNRKKMLYFVPTFQIVKKPDNIMGELRPAAKFYFKNVYLGAIQGKEP